ncbi:MAG: 3-phosphoshikimate 1-carboxyvinyltransferase [Candidatus Omnitrophica bacterium]|nr:3-phosphoshikimate 1-carboxyvinyltransferase [Candidatus Omnitrophota bacterium]
MSNNSKTINPAKSIRGEIVLPGDKSISHRAVMLGSISEGVTKIENFLNAEDCLSTMAAFKNLGVGIGLSGSTVTVNGAGSGGLKKPAAELYLGNSGTTMRLLLGILAGEDFECTLSGDDSLSRRPMKRVTEPLRQMGARIEGRDDADLAPLTIHGGRLKGIDHISPAASAQVKSSILFAGLHADGVTSVTEPFKSRDHSERMLKLFGADIASDGLKTTIKKGRSLKGKNMRVPGDISGAAFFIVAALLGEDSELVIKDVGCNKTRTGALEILKEMGANIEINKKIDGWEPVCDLIIRSSKLRPATIERSEIPGSIDELPALMIAAAFAEGQTVIKGAGELRVKETDRIRSMQHNLSRMGAVIRSKGDDVVIDGPGKLIGSDLSSFRDHRTAMAVSIAALFASEKSVIDDVSCVNTSFPEFFNILKSVSIY